MKENEIFYVTHLRHHHQYLAELDTGKFEVRRNIIAVGEGNPADCYYIHAHATRYEVTFHCKVSFSTILKNCFVSFLL